VIEAIHLGRDAIGVEYERRWAAIAADGIALARSQGATGHGEVINDDARQLPGLAPARARGRVALVVTSPPYGPSVHGHVRALPGRVAKFDNTYSADRANLARQDLSGLLDGFTRILAAARSCCAPAASPWSRPGPGASTASWSTFPAPSSKLAAPRAWFRWSGGSRCSPGSAAGSCSPARPRAAGEPCSSLESPGMADKLRPTTLTGNVRLAAVGFPSRLLAK